MKLTKFEQYLLDTHAYLDEIRLRHWLIDSTLLGYVREGRVIEGDKEVHFGVFPEDLDKHMPELKEKYEVYARNHSVGRGITYLMDKGWPAEKNFWEHPVGFTSLQPMYTHQDKFYSAIEGDHCVVWPIKFKQTMKGVKFLGRGFRSPAPREEFLSLYFGDNWREKDTSFNWQKSPLYMTYRQLKNI